MAGSAEPLVDVREVSRRFGTTLALGAVSIRVEAGMVHALLGRNGAGKTTLIRILTGLVAPTSGAVSVDGTNVVAHPHAARRSIGYVPASDRSFYLRLSGFENLLFFARLYGHRRQEAARRVDGALAVVGLEGTARQPVNTYSHGMLKRLLIARALLNDPAVLLIDEATHDLDPEWAGEVRRLTARAAARGAGVIWATQRVEEIRGFADRVTLLDQGLVRFAGTVGELIERAPAGRYVLGVRNGAGTSTMPPELGRLDRRGESEVVLTLARDATLGDAVGFLLAEGVSVVSCRQETPEVEEAFLHVVAGS